VVESRAFERVVKKIAPEGAGSNNNIDTIGRVREITLLKKNNNRRKIFSIPQNQFS